MNRIKRILATAFLPTVVIGGVYLWSVMDSSEIMDKKQNYSGNIEKGGIKYGVLFYYNPPNGGVINLEGPNGIRNNFEFSKENGIIKLGDFYTLPSTKKYSSKSEKDSLEKVVIYFCNEVQKKLEE